MDKIKCNTLIISNYDGGHNFSVAIDGKIYEREYIEDLEKENVLNLLHDIYYLYDCKKTEMKY